MNTSQEHTLEELVGKRLSDLEFKVVLLTEIYESDDRGPGKSVGFVGDNALAKAYIQTMANPSGFQTRKVYVLSNGTSAFAFGSQRCLILLDEVKIREESITYARSLLTPDQQALLGLVPTS